MILHNRSMPSLSDSSTADEEEPDMSKSSSKDSNPSQSSQSSEAQNDRYLLQMYIEEDLANFISPASSPVHVLVPDAAIAEPGSLTGDDAEVFLYAHSPFKVISIL
jgi:hypothetical protein